MDNEIKLKIIDFYKNIDKSLVNNLFKDENIQNVLKLSMQTELSLLNKSRNKWKIKDKRKLLKELDSVKKDKISQLTKSLEFVNDIAIENIKKINEKVIMDINNINHLKKNIEKDDIYDNIKNITKKNYSSKIDKRTIKNEEIINLEPNDKKSKYDYLEIYSN
jgi:hypothetical protein